MRSDQSSTPRRGRHSTARRAFVLAVVGGATLVGAASALAGTYYVDPAGSDSASGSQSAPWRSVAKVNGAGLGAGDSVLFKGGGVWREMLSARSGSSAAHLTYGSYGTGRAVLDGASASGYAGIEVAGDSYVDFRGLELRNWKGGHAVYLQGATNALFDDMNIHDNAGGVFTSTAAASSNVTVQNSTILRSETGSGGIDFQVTHGSSGFVLKDSDIGYSGDSCILDQGSDTLYLRDRIHDCGYQLTAYGTHGLYLKGPNLTLRDSEIWGARSNCVSIRFQGAVVEGNRIHGCPIAIGWFDYATAKGTQTIRRNRIWNSSTAIYTDESDATAGPTPSFNISNNTIIGSGGSEGIIVNNAIGLHLENNVFAGSLGTALRTSGIGSGGYSERNSVFAGSPSFGWNSGSGSFASYRSATGQGSGSMLADPQLAALDGTDFSLRATSPAIDKGTTATTTAPLTVGCDGAMAHYCGAAPDVGAIEVLSGGSGGGDTTAPSVPTGLTGTPSATSVALAWTASTDATGVTGYQVYRDGALVTTVTGTTATVSGLTAGTAYSFAIAALDAAGNVSARGGLMSVTTATQPPQPGVDTTAPTVPTGVNPSVVGTISYFNWTPSTDNVAVTGYRVYLDGRFIKTVATASTQIIDLVYERTYSVAFAAVDAAGNVSGQSVPVQVVAHNGVPAGDTVAPSQPAGLTGAASRTTVWLSWDDATDDVAVTGYRVTRNGTVVATVVDPWIAVTGLTPATAYQFTVVALDAAGNASAAGALTVTTRRAR